MAKLKRFFKIILFLAVVAYLLFCLMVYLRPQWFFYNPSAQPSRLENAHANGYKGEYVTYNSEDGTLLHGWLTKPQSGQKMIVFLHGNSYNIEKFYHKLIPLVEHGYGTFMPEYRGFGGIAGEITEPALAADAQAAVAYLHQQGYTNENIVLYGMSLGSYTATNTAFTMGNQEPFAGIILEVPFDSLVNVIKDVFPLPLPLKYIVKDTYDNVSRITSVRSPMLIMGGTDDEVVPVERAKNLFAHAQEPKKMIIYQGAGHNDLYNLRNYNDIINWLKANEKTQR